MIIAAEDAVKSIIAMNSCDVALVEEALNSAIKHSIAHSSEKCMTSVGTVGTLNKNHKDKIIKMIKDAGYTDIEVIYVSKTSAKPFFGIVFFIPVP